MLKYSAPLTFGLVLLLSACSDFSAQPETSLPKLVWDSTSSTEGNASSEASATFTFHLNKAAVNASIDYITADGSAQRDSDYVFSSGTLHFEEASTIQTLAIPLVGDHKIEDDETFVLVLGNAVNLTLAETSAYATIVDDDDPTTIHISSEPTVEGDDVAIMFTANISHLVDQVSFDYSTVSGSALADVDYETSSGSIEFTPGLSQETFSVKLLDDDLAEDEEQFSVVLSNPQNAALAATEINGTIIDDDSPILTIQDSSITEGDLHQYTQMTFTLAVDWLFENTSVDYELQSYGAIADEDFQPQSGSLSFAENLEQYIVVEIYGDHTVESAEQFFVTLSSLQNLRAERLDAVGTIYDNDQRANLLLSADSAYEPDNLDRNSLTLTLSLDSYSEGVGIAYKTVDYEALAGLDYELESGVLQMSFDQLQIEHSLQIVGDQIADGNERFLLEITEVTGANYDTEQKFTLTISDDNDDIPITCLSSSSSLDFGSVATYTEYSRDLNIYNSCDYTVQLDGSNHPLPEGFRFTSQYLLIGGQSSADWEIKLYAEYEANLSASILGKFDLRALISESVEGTHYAGSVQQGQNGLDELEGAYALQHGHAVDELYVSGYFGGGLFVYSGDDLSLKQRLVHNEYGYSGLEGNTWIEYNEVYDEILVFGGSRAYSTPFVVYKRNKSTGLFYQAQMANAEEWTDINGASISYIDASMGLISTSGNELVLVADNDPATFADDLLVVYSRASDGSYVYQRHTSIGEDSPTDWDINFRVISGLAWAELDSGVNFIFLSSSTKKELGLYTMDGNYGLSLRQQFQQSQDSIATLEAPKMLAVTSDHDFVYLADSGADAIHILQLQDNGNYAFLDSFAEDDAPDANLSGARSLELSASENHLFVSTRDPAGIVVLERDSNNGLLSYSTQANSLNQNNVPELNSSLLLEINAVGDRAFLSQYNGHALHAFDLDPVSGNLFFDQVAVRNNTNEGFRGLKNPSDIVVDTNNDYLYALSLNEQAVTIFALADDYGIDHLAQTYTSTDSEYLDSPTSLAISPDGKYLLVMSNSLSRIAVFAVGAGSIEFSSVFGFDSDASLAAYKPQSMAFTPDSQQGIVLVNNGVESDLLILDYDSSSGELSSPELLASSEHLEEAEEFLISPNGNLIYAIITANEANAEGQLVVFTRNNEGKISYGETKEGDTSGSNGIKKPINIAQSPDGSYLFLSGQTMINDTTAASAISILNVQSNLGLENQYYENISILTNEDVRMAISASALVLYSAAGELAIYEYDPISGVVNTIAALTLEELVNSASRERGIAGIAAGAFGGDYFYTAGSDSHAIGSIKIQ